MSLFVRKLWRHDIWYRVSNIYTLYERTIFTMHDLWHNDSYNFMYYLSRLLSVRVYIMIFSTRSLVRLKGWFSTGNRFLWHFQTSDMITICVDEISIWYLLKQLLVNVMFLSNIKYVKLIWYLYNLSCIIDSGAIDTILALWSNYNGLIPWHHAWS